MTTWPQVAMIVLESTEWKHELIPGEHQHANSDQ